MMLTIGQVAARAGVKPSAIRYYEQLGLLPKAPRRGATRVYDRSVFDRLAVITLAKAAGFELMQIRNLLISGAVPSLTWREMARTRLDELRREAERVATQRAIIGKLQRCECETLRGCAALFEMEKSTDAADA